MMDGAEACQKTERFNEFLHPNNHTKVPLPVLCILAIFYLNLDLIFQYISASV
jgi:hypothetical protein